MKINTLDNVSKGLMVLAVAMLLFSGLFSSSEATTKLTGTSTDVDPWVFTLTDAANSDFFRMQGLYVCKLDDAGGGSWGGGTATLQKLLFGSPSSGTYVNVQTAALVGATSDVVWTEFTAGVGYYKWVVTGGSSMSITAHCGKAY